MRISMFRCIQIASLASEVVLMHKIRLQGPLMKKISKKHCWKWIYSPVHKKIIYLCINTTRFAGEVDNKHSDGHQASLIKRIFIYFLKILPWSWPFQLKCFTAYTNSRWGGFLLMHKSFTAAVISNIWLKKKIFWLEYIKNWLDEF